ncbi:helix-turn-helix domain-containing protein, partial [Streptococcus pneumoniae]
MQEHYTPKGKHLTIDNRRLIERWKNENKSNREIAGLLGKAPQTIHNEVKRGTTLQQVRKGKFILISPYHTSLLGYISKEV